MAVTSLRMTPLPPGAEPGPPACLPGNSSGPFVPAQGDGHFPRPAPSPGFLQAQLQCLRGSISAGKSQLGWRQEAQGEAASPTLRDAPSPCLLTPRCGVERRRGHTGSTPLFPEPGWEAPPTAPPPPGHRGPRVDPTPWASHRALRGCRGPTHLEMDSSSSRAFCSSSCICLLMSSSPSEAEDGVPASSQRSRSALDWDSGDQGQSQGRGWGQVEVAVRVRLGSESGLGSE